MLTIKHGTYSISKNQDPIPCLILEDNAGNEYTIRTTEDVVETINQILDDLESTSYIS